MKRTPVKVRVSLNEKDVLDAVAAHVRTTYPDLDDAHFDITVSVSKRGIYSATAEVIVK